VKRESIIFHENPRIFVKSIKIKKCYHKRLIERLFGENSLDLQAPDIFEARAKYLARRMGSQNQGSVPPLVPLWKADFPLSSDII